MKALILVGGFGTRMRPLTLTIPKPILPICNTPFLVHQILHLKSHGVTEVVLCMQYLPEVMQEVLAKENLGVKIHFVTEDIPLGTAGAIRNAEAYIGNEPIIVCNGDVLTDFDITAMWRNHQSKGAAVSIATTPVEDPTAFGLVISTPDGQITEFLEKPKTIAEARLKSAEFYINAGTYILNPKVVFSIPAKQKVSIERETFPNLLKAGELFEAYASNAYWLDLGTPEKYLQAHGDLLSGKFEATSHKSNAYILNANTERSNATLKGFACFGENVKFGAGCIVENSVLLNDVILGSNVQINSAIIGNNCVIGDEVVLSPGTVVGDYSKIF